MTSTIDGTILADMRQTNNINEGENKMTYYEINLKTGNVDVSDIKTKYQSKTDSYDALVYATNYAKIVSLRADGNKKYIDSCSKELAENLIKNY